jgi:hypothetical protein
VKGGDLTSFLKEEYEALLMPVSCVDLVATHKKIAKVKVFVYFQRFCSLVLIAGRIC